MNSIFLPIIDNGMGLSRTSWAIAMMAACLGPLRDREVKLHGVSYPYPGGAMEIATTDFLESGCDEMVIIDTDVIYRPIHLEYLLSHDLPIVFGLYPKKQSGLEFPCIPLDGDTNVFADDGRPALREVAATARGFMRVHRDVFTTLKQSSEKINCAQTGREQWLFWKPLPGGHSEDFAFCDLARAHGFKIMVDTRICAQHEGSAVYPIKGTY